MDDLDPQDPIKYDPPRRRGEGRTRAAERANPDASYSELEAGTAARAQAEHNLYARLAQSNPYGGVAETFGPETAQARLARVREYSDRVRDSRLQPAPLSVKKAGESAEDTREDQQARLKERTEEWIGADIQRLSDPFVDQDASPKRPSMPHERGRRQTDPFVDQDIGPERPLPPHLLPSRMPGESRRQYEDRLWKLPHNAKRAFEPQDLRNMPNLSAPPNAPRAFDRRGRDRQVAPPMDMGNPYIQQHPENAYPVIPGQSINYQEALATASWQERGIQPDLSQIHGAYGATRTGDTRDIQPMQNVPGVKMQHSVFNDERTRRMDFMQETADGWTNNYDGMLAGQTRRALTSEDTNQRRVGVLPRLQAERDLARYRVEGAATLSIARPDGGAQAEPTRHQVSRNPYRPGQEISDIPESNMISPDAPSKYVVPSRGARGAGAPPQAFVVPGPSGLERHYITGFQPLARDSQTEERVGHSTRTIEDHIVEDRSQAIVASVMAHRRERDIAFARERDNQIARDRDTAVAGRREVTFRMPDTEDDELPSVQPVAGPSQAPHGAGLSPESRAWMRFEARIREAKAELEFSSKDQVPEPHPGQEAFPVNNMLSRSHTTSAATPLSRPRRSAGRASFVNDSGSPIRRHRSVGPEDTLEALPNIIPGRYASKIRRGHKRSNEKSMLSSSHDTPHEPSFLADRPEGGVKDQSRPGSPMKSALYRNASRRSRKGNEDVQSEDSYRPEVPPKPKMPNPPMKDLFGEKGYLDRDPDPMVKKDQKPKSAGWKGFANNLKQNMSDKKDTLLQKVEIFQVDKMRSISAGFKGKSKVEEKPSTFPISLDYGYQMRLFGELDLMLTTIINDFLMKEKEAGRISLESVQKIKKQWANKGRAQVVDFRFDLATQMELIKINADNLRFHGPNAFNWMRQSAMLNGGKDIARELGVRSFCSADSAIKKMMSDSWVLLELLGAGATHCLLLQKLQQGALMRMEAAAKEREASRSGVTRPFVPAAMTPEQQKQPRSMTDRHGGFF